MSAFCRFVGVALFVAMANLSIAVPARAASVASAEQVLATWYRMVLELVRHTPTYTPPVASRGFAYIGITAYEAVASGSDDLQTLAGQLNGLQPVPAREDGVVYDEAVVLQAAMAQAIQHYFANTGPTGQHAMASLGTKQRDQVAQGVDPEVLARSEAYGQAVADHVIAWSQDDGGDTIENMGFPMTYEVGQGPEHWVPTNLVRLQQAPLLPSWGKNRTFALPDTDACPLPPPPAYSEDTASEFYRQAFEVYETTNALTPDQRMIARFWADDAMLSTTPPGHWISIALQIQKRDSLPMEARVETLALTGIAAADAFIGAWKSKYDYDLLRPITYIRRVIDPKWEPLLNTPPFPEYPSGHSTLSGASATVLTALLGDDLAFDDATPEADGIPPRSFPNFWAAAQEAGISRLYGGIHYRAAIDNGLEQGRCIGTFAAALKTRKE